MKFRLPVFFSVVAVLLSQGHGDTNRELYTQTKTTIEQWVETENLISVERNRWMEEEALLNDTLSMLKAEKEALEAKLEEQKSSSTIADEKRMSLLEEKEALETTSLVIADTLDSLEASIRELLPRLPSNFSNSAQPIIRRLPKKGSESKQSISHRMRNIVALLSQASKFDNAISLEREIRKMGDGTSKEVSTLYFGFAIAYYADASGEYAGYGYPTDSGWNWIEAQEYGPAVLDAMAMYEKNKQAAFVTLPVVIN